MLMPLLTPAAGVITFQVHTPPFSLVGMAPMCLQSANADPSQHVLSVSLQNHAHAGKVRVAVQTIERGGWEMRRCLRAV